MKKISWFGNEIVNNFLEHCKTLDCYDEIYTNNIDAKEEILCSCVRNEEDYAALCLLAYGISAYNIIIEKQSELKMEVLWRNRQKRFAIRYKQVINILEKSIKITSDNIIYVKDLKSLIPKYCDGSGYDCQIIYDDCRHSLFLCEHELYRPEEKPEQDRREVKQILPGIMRSGGHYDDTLAIVVEGKKF